MMFDVIRHSLLFAMNTASKKASAEGRPVLAVASTPVAPVDLLSAFTRYYHHDDVSLWLGLAGKSILGVGSALECFGQSSSRFSTVSSQWHAAIDGAVVVGGIAPFALGGFRFDPACNISPIWENFKDGALSIPRLAVLHLGDGNCHVVAADYVPPHADLPSRFERMVSLLENKDSISGSAPLAQPVLLESEKEKHRWHALVHAALRDISQGKARKIVAARMLRVKADVPFAMPDIVQRLKMDNPKAAVFAFGRKGAYFVGATPEVLLTANAGFFRTMALAGSAPRSEDPAQDAAFGQGLLASEKERQEHDFVVQAVSQALRSRCRCIAMDASPSLHKLKSVQHLVTHFEGEIIQPCNLLDIIEQLHPTPAVGGVPCNSALEFLRAHEGCDRGWYAGPVGWLDALGNGEFMVSLRSGVINGRNASLFAGCGLVAGSDSEKEYRETQLKFSTMLDGVCPEWRKNKAMRVNGWGIDQKPVGKSAR
jgi:salicylate biosynthesis isochorismate synthase